MKDIRQSSNYAHYLKTLGWKIDKIDNIYYFTKKFPLIGSVLKIQRPERLNFKDITNLSKKNSSFRIIIEPKNFKQEKTIIKKGFKQTKSPYLPTKTLTLDLKPNINEIKLNLTKSARYYLRKTKKLSVKHLNKVDIDRFRLSWKSGVGINRYVPPTKHLKNLKKHFGSKSAFLATGENTYNSGAIFLIHDKKAYYWQAFTNPNGRKLFSQYKIVWRGICWAKKSGADLFDFEGVYDKRFPNKKWRGFTHFKKNFSGKEKLYPGAFVKNKLPFV
jgi:hypothetical protein